MCVWGGLGGGVRYEGVCGAGWGWGRSACITTSSPAQEKMGVTVEPRRTFAPATRLPLYAYCRPRFVTVPTSSSAKMRQAGTVTHSLPASLTQRYGACGGGGGWD